jgi:hypothetical protein
VHVLRFVVAASLQTGLSCASACVYVPMLQGCASSSFHRSPYLFFTYHSIAFEPQLAKHHIILVLTLPEKH